ncbi:MAG: Alpha/beta hydrolase family protein [Modestobacter sp.]|nr:Alpha/beta hydrolase family protein [Modestobacter sp.]
MRRLSPVPVGTRVVRVTTPDGVALSGIVVPARAAVDEGPIVRRPAFVLAHGFTNSVGRAPSTRLVGWLRRFGEVRALDFRGHGSSGGGCSAVGGDPEVRDAAVAAARADGADAIVTVGLSMGGGVALRQAAVGVHRPDAVVGVSAVSRWYVRDTRPMRRVHWLLETTAGRRLGATALGLRLDVPWTTVPPAPVQLVGRIAPTPLLLVHGDRDAYFPLQHFRTLAQAAGPAATVWTVPGMGHAESGMTAPLAERIGRWAVSTVGDATGHGPAVPACAARRAATSASIGG